RQDRGGDTEARVSGTGGNREKARREGGRLRVPGPNHCVGARRRGGGEEQCALSSVSALQVRGADGNREGSARGAGVVEVESACLPGQTAEAQALLLEGALSDGAEVGRLGTLVENPRLPRAGRERSPTHCALSLAGVAIDVRRPGLRGDREGRRGAGAVRGSGDRRGERQPAVTTIQFVGGDRESSASGPLRDEDARPRSRQARVRA